MTSQGAFYEKLRIAVPFLILLLFAGAAGAQSPRYFELWNQPGLQERIRNGIETFRKGDAVIEISDSKGKPVTDATISVQQVSHEFLFGCNLFVLGQLKTPELNEKYEKAFTHLFNFATLPFYWRDLEPVKGKTRFREGSEFVWRRPPPDRLVKWCRDHKITAKGHALMYVKNSFMPDWTARNNSAKLLEQGRKHISEIARRYKEDITAWDVVNEELHRIQHPGPWPELPDNFPAWCFREAERRFPEKTILIYNDGTFQAHETVNEYEVMIKGLKNENLRVSGLGMQFHMRTDKTGFFDGKLFPPDQLMNGYDQLGKLNIPMFITEISIVGQGEKGFERQAVAIENLYRLWFSIPNMAGITWWNLGDGTAYENENAYLSGLLDQNMDPKPAYQALDRLINGEWKTSLTTVSDASGKATFRGFHGQYKVSVTVKGVKSEYFLDLKKGTDLNRMVIKI